MRSAVGQPIAAVLSVTATLTWAVPVGAAPVGDADINYPAAVLGIEAKQADDYAVGQALTRALRKALDARGLGGGQEVSLVELRLALGCEDNDPDCLADGGPTLLTDRLVYGTLSPADSGYLVELSVLDVPSRSVTASMTATVVAGDLVPGSVDETAERLVSRLIRPKAAEPVAPQAERTSESEESPPPPPEVVRDESPAPVSRDSLIARPVPKWKWAGLGVGAALTVGGLVTAVVSGVRLQGPLRDAVFDAAERSLEDCIDSDGGSVPCENDSEPRNTANDVDPNMDGDLCQAGRATEDENGNPYPGVAVRNAAVSDACNSADTARTINTAGLAVMGVGLAATAVFTALLFFPLRKNRKATSALKRRSPTIGFSPAPGGGVLGGSFRF